MVAPIRYLSRRIQEQKIGILQSTEEEKVLEVVGRVGIGTTIFDAEYNLDVRGTANVSGILSVGQIISGAGNSFSDLNISGIATFQGDVIIGGGLTVSGISTISQPSNANPHSLWDVVNNGSSAYRFTGPGQSGDENNPNIYLVRGQRYIFKVNASGHPFQLRVANGGAAYSDGVTNNGAQSGNVVINVQHDAPAQLYYQCTNHGGMVGNIYIIGGPQVISGVVTATTFSGDLTGNAGTATSLATARDFEITGDVVASAISFDGTGNVSLAATIQPNSVELGTDTTGNYVQSITGTSNEIEVTGGTGESSTPQIGLPNDVTISQDLTVTRDVNILRNLDVIGNITVGGTSATLFTTTLEVEDPDIVLGVRTDAFGNDVSTDNTANHGGIAIASTEGNPIVNLNVVGIETLPPTYKKIMWFKSGSFTGLATDAWLTNYAFGIGTTSMSNGTRLAVGNIEFNDDDITSITNINATGIITASSFSGDGASVTNVDAETLDGLDSTQFLRSDVDDIKTGVTTFSDAADFNGDIDVDGHTELDDLNVSGFSTFRDRINVISSNVYFTEGFNILTTLGNTMVNLGSLSVGIFNRDFRVFNYDLYVENSFNNDRPFFVDNSGSSDPSKVGINSSTPRSELDVRGNVIVSGVSTFSDDAYFGGQIYINETTLVGSATSSLTTVASTPIYTGLSTTIYRSVEYTIQATEGTNFHSTKILALHDGTTAYHSEYGTIFNNSSVATFDVDVSSGNIRLVAVGATSDQTDYVINFTATKL